MHRLLVSTIDEGVPVNENKDNIGLHTTQIKLGNKIGSVRHKRVCQNMSKGEGGREGGKKGGRETER